MTPRETQSQCRWWRGRRITQGAGRHLDRENGLESHRGATTWRRATLGVLLTMMAAGVGEAAAPGSTEIRCDVNRTQFRSLAQGQTQVVFQLWDADVGGVQCGAHAVSTTDITALRLTTESFSGVPRRQFLELRTVIGDNAVPAQLCAGENTWVDVVVGATTLGCNLSGRRRLHSVAYARNTPGASDGDGIETGTILPYAGTGVPAGWLRCDGAAVSRTTYAALFGVVGTSFGVGDGATTFNLPDLRGRLPVGRGIHADVSAIGLSDGDAPASRRTRHIHTVSPHVHHVPDHVHSFKMLSGINNNNLLNIDPRELSNGAFPLGENHSVANGAHIGFTANFPLEIYVQNTFLSGGVDTDTRAPATDAQGPSYLVVSYIVRADGN